MLWLAIMHYLEVIQLSEKAYNCIIYHHFLFMFISCDKTDNWLLSITQISSKDKTTDRLYVFMVASSCDAWIILVTICGRIF